MENHAAKKKSIIINNLMKMEVIKRNNVREKVSFDKILVRIERLCKKLNLTRIDPIDIAKETIQGLYDGITTEELDHFASVKCAEKILDDIQYNYLAAGLCISNLHKTTDDNFLEISKRLYENADNDGKHHPLINKEYYEIVKKNIDRIQAAFDYERDYTFDFFGVKTLERAYLLRTKTGKKYNFKNEKSKETLLRQKYGNIIERPQHMLMRVALAIHGNDIDKALETYELMSKKYFIHATPTLYNAGSNRQQCSSCYLLNMDDSIDAIFETIADIAKISKFSGGIGLTLSNIRGSGSLIRGTNGNSDGIVPLMQVLDAEGRYVNQSGKRNGSIACYIEPWHPEVYEFCEMRKNTGKEKNKARDLFLALWVPDLFMKRVESKQMWSLMCPDECPGLTTSYGEEFEALYLQYEKQGKYKKQVHATDLWFHILSAQIETGMPYLLFKDNINRQSNQKNIGVIQSSNLCTEIVQYTSQNEISVCNLASICLPTFLEANDDGRLEFNFTKLLLIAKVVTINLNKIIDINFYPVDKARKSNMKHRPIGIGVQGLSDLFCMLEIPFDSQEAYNLNKKIFETIYFGCLTASNELAKEFGPYETFWGSPFSEGKLQFHLWGLTEDDLLMDWDWKTLISNIKKYGTRNSLLTTVMPTASTSQIMGFQECTEPITTNLYTRTTLAGEYTVVNKYLVEKLIKEKLWTKEIREEFIYDKGSIQKIDEIPDEIKENYKTAFEMNLKPVVQHAINRGPFIDQSQSTNIFLSQPDFQKLMSSHFYGWKNKLKTGMYYLRTRPAVDPINFGLDPLAVKRIKIKRGLSMEEEESSDENNESDPRRINEIEINHKQYSNQDGCEVCHG